MKPRFETEAALVVVNTDDQLYALVDFIDGRHVAEILESKSDIIVCEIPTQLSFVYIISELERDSSKFEDFVGSQRILVQLKVAKVISQVYELKNLRSIYSTKLRMLFYQQSISTE